MFRPVAGLACLTCALVLLAAPASAVADWRWPVGGEVITHYRNGTDPYAGGQHRGIDISADPGTPVVAAAGGTVRFAGVAGSSGLTVSVRTTDGRFDTSYLHLSNAAVRERDVVSAGDRLGAVGASGRRTVSTPHLHFGVRDAGTRHAYVDPLTLLGSPPPASRPPEAPRVAPAPVSVPVAPAPVRVPDPAARPVRLPAGRRVPVGRRVPAVRGARAPRTGPSPAAVSGFSPAPAPSPLPSLGRERVPEPGRATVGGVVPALGPDAPGAPAPAVAARPAPTGARQRPDGGGPDVGWALACLGLLLSAAMMGRARRPQRRRGHGRAVRPDPRAAPIAWRSPGHSVR